jgi:Large ribosomal RNA subunit accumulation protein YceD
VTHEQHSPISFRASVVRLPQKGMPVTIEADEDQRRLLAQQHGLLGVECFRADLVVSKWKGEGVRVSGQVDADITQACVVSLDPMDAHVNAEIEALFVPEDSRLSRAQTGHKAEILLDAEGPDSPEPFLGDTIDVGALAEQYFALAIDPYPRKEGASLEETSPASGGEAPRSVIAEKLAALKLRS